LDEEDSKEEIDVEMGLSILLNGWSPIAPPLLD
jgi:hypothetical protein